MPGADNAGKPGYYTVRSGDTLIKIGLDQGQNWRDLVRWNNLDNPNVIRLALLAKRLKELSTWREMLSGTKLSTKRRCTTS